MRAGHHGGLILFTPAQHPLTPIVIRFGRLGDMIVLSSVLPLLHQRYGAPCIVLGAGPWNGGIYRGHPDVSRVHSFTRHLPFAASVTWWHTLRDLRRTDPGPIYVFERSPRQLRRIRRMLALSGIDTARCVFMSDTAVQEDEHGVDAYVRFAQTKPPGITDALYPVAPQVKPAAPRLRVLDGERSAMRQWLQAQGLGGRPLLLIQPGNFRSMSRRRQHWRESNADDKAWPAARWVELLQKIVSEQPDVALLLCGAPQEADMLQQLAAAAMGLPLLVAALPLREMLALCEQAHCMISVDTGPAHAAAALGLPLVVMYGAEAQVNWLPRSPTGSPVVGIGGPPVSARVDNIAVETVMEAWRALALGMSTGHSGSPLALCVS